MKNNSKRNILIDFQSLKNLNCGLGQFSLYLSKAINKGNKTNSLTFLLPKSAIKLFPITKYETTNRWKKKPFYNILKPFLFRKKYDLWHTTEQLSKFYPYHKNTPMIFTIHDLNVLRDKSPKKDKKKIKNIQNKINRASIITTISHFVAKELKEHLDFKGKEIKVIYNGLNKNNTSPIKPTSFQISTPYLFTIGQVVPKKNNHVLIDFILKTDYNLVIAGDATSKYAQDIKCRVKALGLEDKVSICGLVNEGEKKWLYQNCKAFVFPSITEGFGLPVIEAMHYGKPVFMSNSTSLPEVGGEFGFYWDNYTAEHMVNIFDKGLNIYNNDSSFKQKLISHSQKFSWDNSAKEYLKLYDEILNRNKNNI